MTGEELHAEYQAQLQKYSVWTAPWDNVQRHIQAAWEDLAVSIDQRAGMPIQTNVDDASTIPKDTSWG